MAISNFFTTRTLPRHEGICRRTLKPSRPAPSARQRTLSQPARCVCNVRARDTGARGGSLIQRGGPMCLAKTRGAGTGAGATQASKHTMSDVVNVYMCTKTHTHTTSECLHIHIYGTHRHIPLGGKRHMPVGRTHSCRVFMLQRHP